VSDVEPMDLCVFVPCYNVERFVEPTMRRVDWRGLAKLVRFRVLFVDNASTDKTWAAVQSCLRYLTEIGVDAEAIRNPVDRGYGGSNKIVFAYCRERGIPAMGILHSDGQYAPEELTRLVEEWKVRPHCALFYGSRLLGHPLRGGMPLYKFVANKSLTWVQNVALGSRISEFHSGYRFYRMAWIRRLAYEATSDYFDFDTQIIFQIRHAGGPVEEMAIPTHYGEEVSNVNGLRTAKGILANVGVYLLHRWGLKRSERFRTVDG